MGKELFVLLQSWEVSAGAEIRPKQCTVFNYCTHFLGIWIL